MRLDVDHCYLALLAQDIKTANSAAAMLEKAIEAEQMGITRSHELIGTFAGICLGCRMSVYDAVDQKWREKS